MHTELILITLSVIIVVGIPWAYLLGKEVGRCEQLTYTDTH